MHAYQSVPTHVVSKGGIFFSHTIRLARLSARENLSLKSLLILFSRSRGCPQRPTVRIRIIVIWIWVHIVHYRKKNYNNGSLHTYTELLITNISHRGKFERMCVCAILSTPSSQALTTVRAIDYLPYPYPPSQSADLTVF